MSDLPVDSGDLAKDFASLKAHLVAKEQAEAKKISTWLKANWLHISTATGVGSIVAKIFGLLH